MQYINFQVEIANKNVLPQHPFLSQIIYIRTTPPPPPPHLAYSEKDGLFQLFPKWKVLVNGNEKSQHSNLPTNLMLATCAWKKQDFNFVYCKFSYNKLIGQKIVRNSISFQIAFYILLYLTFRCRYTPKLGHIQGQVIPAILFL